MKKKCLGLFNKKTPLYAGLGSKQKLLATAKQLIRQNSVLLFEKSGNLFHRVNVQIASPHPVYFRLLFKDSSSPLHDGHTF